MVRDGPDPELGPKPGTAAESVRNVAGNEKLCDYFAKAIKIYEESCAI